MPPILDVAIGTVFVFLLFSLVISALNEYILSLTDQRAKFLRLGLAELFGSGVRWHPWDILLGPLKSIVTAGGLFRWGIPINIGADAEKLLSHGLINAFSRSDNGGNSPSYLPAGAFVIGLLDIVVAGAGGPAAAWSQANAHVLSGFITAIQRLSPTGPAPISTNDYTTALDGFLTPYGGLNPLPTSGLLFEFKKKVEAAAAKPAAQAALLAAGGLAAAAALIPRQLPDLRPELTEAVNRADGDENKFRVWLTQWFDTNRELYRLEVAASAALTLMVAPVLKHTTENIAAGISCLPAGSKLRESLESLYRTVDGDVQKFKLAVEGWFNGVMDRVSGWYKRFAQKWMIVFGFALAAVFNVDTIEIVRVLSNNPNLAKAVANQAGVHVQTSGRPLTASELGAEREAKLQAVQTADHALENARATGKDEATLRPLAAAVTAANADLDALGAYQDAVKRLYSTGLPIGWTPEAKKKLGLHVTGDNPSSAIASPSGSSSEKTGLKGDILLGMLAGWFLTAIAASLGAPFWFDLLGRFVNIRAAGRAPGEKEATSTPTRPPPASLDTTPGTHATGR